MHVTIKLYGNLKKYHPEKQEVGPMDVGAGPTIASLLARLQVPDAEVWMSAVNDNVVDPSTVLQEGDLLEVFEPVGGGARSEDRIPV